MNPGPSAFGGLLMKATRAPEHSGQRSARPRLFFSSPAMASSTLPPGATGFRQRSQITDTFLTSSSLRRRTIPGPGGVSC